jgi:hypothetical protein
VEGLALSASDREGLVAGSCVHGNCSSASVIGEKFLDQPSDY